MAMHQDSLFGDPTSVDTKKITIREIQTVMKTVVLREDAPSWVSNRFTAPAQVFEMFRELYNETKEHFVTLHLDGKNRILCKDTVSIGSLNQSIVHPREVFKTALLSNAAAILLIHNHPTGDPNPSPEDRAITSRLKEAGDLLGIRVLDHIIIGDDRYLSFVEAGLM
jgi:DNA repair protein RadC